MGWCLPNGYLLPTEARKCHQEGWLSPGIELHAFSVSTFPQLRQFEGQVQPIKSWMANILPTLDDSQPVDGDIATVHELYDAHEVIYIHVYRRSALNGCSLYYVGISK